MQYVERRPPLVIRIADRSRMDGRIEGFVVGTLLTGSICVICLAISYVATVVS